MRPVISYRQLSLHCTNNFHFLEFSHNTNRKKKKKASIFMITSLPLVLASEE